MTCQVRDENVMFVVLRRIYDALSYHDPIFQMALTLRPTDLDRSPAMAALEDWIILDDGKPIGRIYQRRAPASTAQTWFWSITADVEPRAVLRTAVQPRRWARPRQRSRLAGFAGAHGWRDPGSTQRDRPCRRCCLPEPTR